jgi:integrase
MPLTLVPPRKGRSRFYRIRGTVRGRHIDETTGVESRELAEAIRIKREGQILDESIFGPRASRRFSEAAVSYIETIRPGPTQTIAIIGRERGDGTLSRSLIDDFGPMLVSAIDQAAVDKIMRERFGRVTQATLQRHLLTPLISVLTFAAERKWCDRPQLWRPPAPKGRSRWLTYEEADKVLSAAAPHIYRLALFLMLTGARMSEVTELDWRDVSLAGRWAVFRDTKRKDEDRGVPLHPQLIAMLANLRHRQGRVFLTNRGLPYAEREGGGQIKTAWAATLRRAGVVDIRPHDLRHTFSTWLTLSGTHEQIRDEIMGHASTDMGRRYSHVPREELVRAVDKLPNRVNPVERQLYEAAKRKANHAR